MKYYIISDTHGVHPKVIQATTEEIGIDLKVDTLVVCGDITYGEGNDAELLDWLYSLPHTILIKGNHDFGNVDTYVNDKNFTTLTKENITKLKAMDYQKDCDEFIIAHGLYITDKLAKALTKDEQEIVSTWCSPFYLDDNEREWQQITPEIQEKVKGVYKSMKAYNKDLHKPLFVGHVSYLKLGSVLPKGVSKSGNIMKYKKITFVDCNIMHNGEVEGVIW